MMDMAKHLQAHRVPSTHCLADNQGSNLEFPEDRDDPYHRTGMSTFKGIFRDCKIWVWRLLFSLQCPALECFCVLMVTARSAYASPASCMACLLLF